VPAQSANSNVPTYLVDLVEQTCTCPDYELRRRPCKHYEACLFWLSWEGAMNVETGEITLPKKKQQSKQNWPAYNRAQTTERRRVPQFLRSLCLAVPDAERESSTPGRRPIPDREAIFGLVMKVYSGCSGRRAAPRRVGHRGVRRARVPLAGVGREHAVPRDGEPGDDADPDVADRGGGGPAGAGREQGGPVHAIEDSLGKVLRGARDVTARLAYGDGVARLTDTFMARPPHVRRHE
jgi:hypothetical protein